LIPSRFSERIRRHALSVYTIPTYPLILAVQGAPGVGKTFQTLNVLTGSGFELHRESASALQGKHEGDSVEAFAAIYERARLSALDDERPSPAILIEDFDLSGAVRFDDTEYTVNQQLLVLYLMNLCDGIDAGGREAVRLPIFFTGNNFAALHQPLRRHGRLDVFTWEPDASERVTMYEAVLEGTAADPSAAARRIAAEMPLLAIASLRFLLDQVTSQYLYRQIGHLHNLGLSSFREARFTQYTDVPTDRLIAALVDAHDSQEEPGNFLESVDRGRGSRED
jgi:SpoVK/Ycf46/Vps4 family AAA+-type ATPase